MEDRTEELLDALDHIQRIAQNSRTQTRRLRRIQIRATHAIEGRPNWSEATIPKKSDCFEQERVRRVKDRENYTAEIDELKYCLQWALDHIADTEPKDRLTATEQYEMFERASLAADGATK